MQHDQLRAVLLGHVGRQIQGLPRVLRSVDRRQDFLDHPLAPQVLLIPLS
jgi:hypothetical protein